MSTPLNNFEKTGFFVLRKALQAEEVLRMANAISDYVRASGKLLRPHALSDTGGWFVADFPAEPAFAGFRELVESSPKLRAALTEVLGGPSYRALSRQEIYIGRASAWHYDWMHGPLERYATDAPALPGLWGLLPNNETIKLATVAVYLQSHAAANNLNALTVRPGRHLDPAGTARGRGRQELTLHPDVGDVVVFDARLPHRGQDRRHADWTRDRNAPSHRAMLSMQFGRDDAFAERVDRAYAVRNAIFNDESVCGMPLTSNHVLNSSRARQIAKSFSARCIYQAVDADLRRRPLGPLVRVDH